MSKAMEKPMKNTGLWKRWGRRLGILALFAVLVVALLWFQGILFRKEPPTAAVPALPRLAAGAATARVVHQSLPIVLVQPGFVEAVDPAELAARVMATILAVDGRENDVVAAGQTLVTLDDRDARARVSQAEAELAGAEARSGEARLAQERALRLRDAGALTTEEWERADAAREGATALVERARQGLEEARTALSWFHLEAPFAGSILVRHADPGQLALPGQAILEIYRPDALRFRVAVPEERAAGLVLGEAYELEFERLPPVSARLTRILPPADPATGTVTLQLVPESLDGLRPGMLGRLRFGVGQREALVVPAAAVERIGQIERVQLVRDGHLQAVTVRTGKAHAELVEVLSGLSEGELVRLP